MIQSFASKFAIRRRWLQRGESVIASAGLAVAAILLGVMAASAWWTMCAQHDLLQSARLAEVRANSTMLAQSAEVLLSTNDLSALRRLVVDTAREQRLDECRIELSDGQVLADAEISRITVKHLPDSWPVQPSTANDPVEGMISLRLPLDIDGRGKASLVLTAASPPMNISSLAAQSGIGIAGALGLLAMLLVYRRMRARLGPMSLIRDALLARDQGEQSLDALFTRADDGPEAVQWNGMLREIDDLRSQLTANSVLETSSVRTDRGAGLESVCDAMWQGLILVDSALTIRYVNGAAAVLLRAPREDMADRAIHDFVRNAEIIEVLNSVVTGSLRRKSTIEFKEPHESGPVVLRFGIRPVRQGDAAAAMIVIEDLTLQRLAEEARNSFVTQATHELRTPLTNIRLYAENALDVGEEDQAARSKCINVINQEARRLERIVGDMLSVAEIEAGTLKLREGDIRLQALLDELRGDYEAQAIEKSITLQFQLPPKLPVIRGDRDKIALALHNLIGNALKYTPANGSVTVTVDVEHGVVKIDVSDTGIGIREEESELIFEKFFRSADSRVAGITGSGLGLALAREVVRLHRGDITVRSQVDKGSTFTLTVPSLAEAA